MFLKSLTIENCRSLAMVDLDFASYGTSDNVRKWSMLVGENGTGKSTILKAIALLLGGSDALPHLLGSARSWVPQGSMRRKPPGCFCRSVVGRSLSDLAKAVFHPANECLEGFFIVPCQVDFCFRQFALPLEVCGVFPETDRSDRHGQDAPGLS